MRQKKGEKGPHNSLKKKKRRGQAPNELGENGESQCAGTEKMPFVVGRQWVKENRCSRETEKGGQKNGRRDFDGSPERRTASQDLTWERRRGNFFFHKKRPRGDIGQREKNAKGSYWKLKERNADVKNKKFMRGCIKPATIRNARSCGELLIILKF